MGEALDWKENHKSDLVGFADLPCSPLFRAGDFQNCVVLSPQFARIGHGASLERPVRVSVEIEIRIFKSRFQLALLH